jgi:hypothetical protein
MIVGVHLSMVNEIDGGPSGSSHSRHNPAIASGYPDAMPIFQRTGLPVS